MRNKYESILIDHIHENQVVIITLNRPSRLNALSSQVIQDLLDVCLELESNETARVVVLCGAGRAFCAGADLTNFGKNTNIEKKDWHYPSQEHFSRIILKLAQIPQPIIACVQGYAAGAGFSLALAADIRIGGKTFKAMPSFINLGLTGCEMGTSFHLPRFVGSSVASMVLLTGDAIEAEQALRTGLVSAIYEDSEVRDEGVKLAKRMCDKTSFLGLRLTKRQLRSAADGGSLAAVIHSEDVRQVLCMHDRSSKAFMKKMIARFTKKKSSKL